MAGMMRMTTYWTCNGKIYGSRNIYGQGLESYEYIGVSNTFGGRRSPKHTSTPRARQCGPGIN